MEGGFVFCRWAKGYSASRLKIKFLLSKIILAFIYLRISYNRTVTPLPCCVGLSVIFHTGILAGILESFFMVKISVIRLHQLSASRCFIIFSLLFFGIASVNMAHAQSFGRAAKVETQTATQQKIAPQTPIQGRVKTGLMEIITAPANGTVRLADLRIGDLIAKDQKLAEQDSRALQTEHRLLALQIEETQTRIDQLASDIEFEGQLREVAAEKLELLAARLERAEQLRRSQTISPEAYDTTKSAYLAAREQLLGRHRTHAQLSYQRNTARLSAKQLAVQLAELEEDINAAMIKSPVQGQIFELADANALYMREGDKIASIRTDSGFEVEADIPADYIGFLSESDVIYARLETAARSASGTTEQIELRLRAILPTQNSRTSTRPVRFVPVQPLPALARAENTALSLSIPTKAPENLIAISQDALVPVNSGYVVFVAKDGLAEQRIVTLGGTVRDYVVILSGVDAGEEVITKGNEILSDGSKIALPGARADKGAKPGNKSGSWKKQN